MAKDCGIGVSSCERRLNTPQMCRLNFPQVSWAQAVRAGPWEAIGPYQPVGESRFQPNGSGVILTANAAG